MRSVIMSSLALLALAVAPAVAKEVKVRNCSAEQLKVESFNSDDALRWVPYKTITVDARAEGTAECGSYLACYLRVSYGNLVLDIASASFPVNVMKIDSATGSTIFLPSSCN